MAMTKQEANAMMKDLYARNVSLEEADMKKDRKTEHREIISVYGNWDKALRANGITRRKLREREKFMLYMILSERERNYGKEAVRPKNVHPEEFKHRIVKSYKTIKALKDIIGNWNEDKVMYELHLAILTGSTFNSIETENSELHEKSMEYFGSVDNLVENYNKRFGVPNMTKAQFVNGYGEGEQEATVFTATADEQSGEMQPVAQGTQALSSTTAQMGSDEADDLINMMIKLNYINGEDEAKAIVRANRMRKEEVGAFLLRELALVQGTGERVSDETIKAKDLSVYFAIKAHYGNIEGAVQEITRSLFAQAQ